MKKFSYLLLSCLLLLIFSTAAFANQLKIVVNGNPINFTTGTPYVNAEGRVMVPIRFISEQLGAKVSWLEDTQTTLIEYKNQRVAIPINKNIASINEKAVTLDTNAVFKDNRTMVPLRFVSEALGAKVLFSQATNTVRLSTSDIAAQSSASGNNKFTAPPKIMINPNQNYTAILETNRGTIKVRLFSKQTPTTVNNFIFLAKEGFYEGVAFHRIIKDFMIQTGDPLGNGTGGPGYKFNDELPPAKAYGPGIVAMANSGPNTNGSQFFICNGEDAKYLNQSPSYTVFGEVIQGLDVVLKISETPVEQSKSGELSKPLEHIYIEGITIIES